MDFSEIYQQYSFEEVATTLADRANAGRGDAPSGFLASDVQAAIARAATVTEGNNLSEADLMALLSPAADPYLEQMARTARDLTRKRFGNVIQLYTPLYLSNECRSGCTYCGFSVDNDIRRLTLTPQEAEQQADVLYREGIRHILLLTGEDLKATPVSYIAEVAERLRTQFASIGIEVYPLKEEEYAYLRNHGVDSLTLYQETYDPELYRRVHLKGMKSRMLHRLQAPDRAGRAGFRKIAIGALLGLSDSPAAEMFFTAIHARHLMKTHWRTQILIGLPRMRHAAGLHEIPVLPDRQFARFIFALRLFLPDVGLVLSTRESPAFRDNMVELGITQMSAGSRTDPGGYNNPSTFAEKEQTEEQAGEQFHIEDNRSVGEITSMLRAKGLDPVTVDWSASMK